MVEATTAMELDGNFTRVCGWTMQQIHLQAVSALTSGESGEVASVSSATMAWKRRTQEL
jgi:hypothetical protein